MGGDGLSLESAASGLEREIVVPRGQTRNIVAPVRAGCGLSDHLSACVLGHYLQPSHRVALGVRNHTADIRRDSNRRHACHQYDRQQKRATLFHSFLSVRRLRRTPPRPSAAANELHLSSAQTHCARKRAALARTIKNRQIDKAGNVWHRQEFPLAPPTVDPKLQRNFNRVKTSNSRFC
jgi:hypothetical protein